MILPEDLRGARRPTPAPDNVFKTDDQAEKLNKDKVEKRHSATAKCLCLSQISRVDTQLSVGFHCIRVKSSDAQD